MSERQRPRRVTNTELSILEVLWRRGPSRIREIAEAVYGTTSPSRHATVQSLLERLEEKELVDRDRSGHAHVFSAAEERATVIGHELQEIADKVSGGSLTSLLLNLAERVQLSEGERAKLLRLVDEVEPRGARPDERNEGED